MREAGFEPTTSASGGQRSIQLSYSREGTGGMMKLPGLAEANKPQGGCSESSQCDVAP